MYVVCSHSPKGQVENLIALHQHMCGSDKVHGLLKSQETKVCQPAEWSDDTEII